jgi:AcrR family transcriptional regulator
MTPPKPPDSSRRNESARRAILDAAIALIGESGYDAVSIEAIAAQAGVGKQTIYRWWPSKGAVVLEALDDSLTKVVDFPDTGDLIADLRTQMKGVTRLLGTTQVGRVYQGLLGAAQCDPDLSRAHLEQVIRPATVAGRERIERAMERGDLRADADVQTLIDLLYGAIYYRLLLHTRPLTVKQIDQALDITFNGLRSTGS